MSTKDVQLLVERFMLQYNACPHEYFFLFFYVFCLSWLHIFFFFLMNCIKTNQLLLIKSYYFVINFCCCCFFNVMPVLFVIVTVVVIAGTISIWFELILHSLFPTSNDIELNYNEKSFFCVRKCSFIYSEFSGAYSQRRDSSAPNTKFN